MSDLDRAFDRLRAIDPARSVARPARPDPEAVVASLERSATDVELAPVRSLPRRRRTVVLAAAAAITLVAVGAVWLAGQRSTSELEPSEIIIDDVPVSTPPTTPAPTTTATSAPPSSSAAPAGIDAETQALLDRFVSTFNAGDAGEFLALLQPGMNREVLVDRDRRLYSLDLVRDIYLIEADLRTTITLDCEPTSDPTAVTCVPTRYDDLHRILGVPATEDQAWTFRFDDDGLVRSWTERREQQRGVDAYEREVYGPFADWAAENHPDVVGPGLKPAVAGEWVVDERDDIVELVALFAESRGVTLDPDR